MNLKIDIFARLALIAAAIICSGCTPAPKTAHLAGTITIAGQAPPADARVRLSVSPSTPDQGKAAGSTITGNKYDCPNCPLGKVTVFIVVDHPAERTSLIDPSYSAGQELEVTADNLKQDFDLKPYKPN